MITDHGIITAKDIASASAVTETVLETAHAGEALRLAREIQGLSLEQISSKIKVSAEYLSAIETLNIEALPSRGYVLGYVRAYAKELGQDAPTVLKNFKEDYCARAGELSCKAPRRARPAGQRKPKGLVATGMVLSTFAALSVWFLLRPADAAPVAAPATAAAVLTDIAPAKTVFEFGLQATATTWVQVKTPAGEILTSRVLIRGESLALNPDQPVYVSARHGGAVNIVRGDEAVAKLGTGTEPVTDVALNIN